MLTSLLAYIQACEAKANCIDYLLPRLIKHYQADFRVFADCGAGVGHTALKFARDLKSNLDSSLQDGASITAFEPLPENFEELRTQIATRPEIEAIPKAVADYVGETEFVVPRRMQGESTRWGAGTSAVGYIGKSATAETVKVNVTRLDEIKPSGFDFIKLDLQGGELAAMKGSGETLKKAKLIYAEHQLLSPRKGQPLDFLQSNGFICYYDRIQFGLRDANILPLSLLEEAGIHVSRVQLPDGRGMPMILWGQLSFGNRSALLSDGSFTAGFADELAKAGIYYLQTDVVAINAEHHAEIVTLL